MRQNTLFFSFFLSPPQLKVMDAEMSGTGCPVGLGTLVQAPSAVKASSGSWDTRL